jgi:hypothetical protein
VLTRNFFAPHRITTFTRRYWLREHTNGAEGHRKPGRPPPTMTSTTNLIRLQSYLKEQVKGEYEFRNTPHRTCVIAKEMTDYSAMRSYAEKNNLHYFTSYQNSEKPIKAIIRHLPPDTPAEDMSYRHEDLGFNVINVSQMTATRRAPNGQTQVESLPLFLVTLKRNITSQEIFKLNSLNHIIKVELYRAQTGLTQC